MVKSSQLSRNWRADRAAPIAFALCVLSVAIASCNGDDECDIEAQSRKLGGAGLQDCGIAHDGNESVVDRCAASAYAKNETFRALYEIDDGRLQAIVHAAGDAYFLLREGEAGGVERADCADGMLVNEDGRRFVDCQGPSEFVAVCD